MEEFKSSKKYTDKELESYPRTKQLQMLNLKDLNDFNTLPRDVQLTILKESPTFMQMTKSYYTEPNLFKSTFCGLPIDQKELLRFITQSYPNFNIYVISKDRFDIYIFYRTDPNKTTYKQYHSTCVYATSDGKYDFGGILSKREINIENTINTLYKNKNLYLSIDTVYDIMVQRKNCNTQDNLYAVNYTIKYLEDVLKINMENERYHLFIRAFVSAYMETCYFSIKNEPILFSGVQSIQNIIFENNKPTNKILYDKSLLSLDIDIKDNYNNIVNILNQQIKNI